jgi:type IX secretion system PorP/SprF family membrane protein
MKIKRILLSLIFLLSIIVGKSQTPYNSQGFMSPQYFNPASVGFGMNNRFQSFFRTQYIGVGQPFYTAGAGLDFGFLKTDDLSTNMLGYGVQIISDRVLNGILQTNAITNSLSYRVFFNEKKSAYFSLGIGFSVLSRTIDASQLTFGDQYYSGRLFNPSSLEAIKQFPTRYTTNTGFMFGYQSALSYLQIGASAYYINRTTNALIQNNQNQTYQYSALLNFEYQLENENTILLHADYQNRLEKEFVYVGAAVGLPMNSPENRLYIGCFYRDKDAIVPYLGMIHNKYKMGISYDIYNNNFTASNLRPQTIEFSLTTTLSLRISDNLRSLFD